MDEEKKKQIAVFRFGVIADFVTGVRLHRGEKERLLADKCARRWTIPYSKRTSIGRSTIREVRNPRRGGISVVVEIGVGNSRHEIQVDVGSDGGNKRGLVKGRSVIG